jgi:N-acetylglutamate synthase-like GNAT family acetyltransferase
MQGVRGSNPLGSISSKPSLTRNSSGEGFVLVGRFHCIPNLIATILKQAGGFPSNRRRFSGWAGLVSSLIARAASMIESVASTQRIARCRLRPATAQDGKQIRGLTRKLYQATLTHGRSTTLNQPQWQAWLTGIIAGLLGAAIWQYPRFAAALLVSSAPLWLTIGFTLCLASHEQHQQCERYWVVEAAGRIVGCGRVDRHAHHAEIYDLFVLSEWRSQGLGRSIMQQLMVQSPTPIYLASLPAATPFYAQLGFQSIASRELPLLVAGRLSLNSPRYRQVGLQPMVFR